MRLGRNNVNGIKMSRNILKSSKCEKGYMHEKA